MLKTFFGGLKWERHRHQMGLAAGVEGKKGRRRRRMKEKEEPERERSQSVKSYSGVSQKFFPPNRLYCVN